MAKKDYYDVLGVGRDASEEEVREAARLALEPSDDHLLRRDRALQCLDRDGAAQGVLDRPVDDRHPPGGDLFHDLAVADPLQHG